MKPRGVLEVASVVALLVSGMAASCLAVPVPAEIVVKVGDAAGPSTVTGINAPFTNGLGDLGFYGTLADGQGFIWCGAGPVFTSSSALPLVLTGGESTMGVSNNCGFAYSPAVDGLDAIYTHRGVLIKKSDPIAALPNLYSSFNSRPIMLPDGTCWWIGGTATTPTGSTTNRHTFKATDPGNPASIVAVLSGGDVIDGKTISTTATNFGYWTSDNGLHHIHVLAMTDGTDNVYLDGALVAEEGNPTGQGDNWEVFDAVSVNNSGNYVFMGNTDGTTTKDAFVAYNGTIMVREGDTIDGITIPAGVTTRWASIDNNNYVAFMWGYSADEYLFYGVGASLNYSYKVLRTGDLIDVDSDAVADYTVVDFEGGTSIGPCLDLATDGFILVDVSLIPVGGAAEIEAILRLRVDPPSSVGSRHVPGPVSVSLLPSHPNPFESAVSVSYVLAEGGPIRISVYDALGRLVKVLFDGAADAGSHTDAWYGTNADGARVAAGAYFIQLDSPAGSAKQKVVLLR